MTRPDLNVGDRVEFVRLNSDGSPYEGTNLPYFYGGSAGTGTFTPGETYAITRVTTNYIWVRVDLASHGSYDPDDGKTTVQLDRNGYVGGPQADRILYRPADSNYVPPRRLGEKPDGDHLDTNDPRIAWIFEDMGRFASRKRYCAQYDDLCDELGIPGREREFTVKATIPGTDLTVSAKIKATSKSLAQELLLVQLAPVTAAAPAI